jgi:hypothetical protein
MIAGGLLCRVTHDDPATIVIGLALHVEGMPGQARFDQRKFGGNFGRQGSPFLSPGIDANRLWLERPGIEYRIGDIGARVLEQHALFAR